MSKDWFSRSSNKYMFRISFKWHKINLKISIMYYSCNSECYFFFFPLILQNNAIMNKISVNVQNLQLNVLLIDFNKHCMNFEPFKMILTCRLYFSLQIYFFNYIINLLNKYLLIWFCICILIIFNCDWGFSSI